MNERIRFNEVLLIGPKGEQLGVVSRRVALETAERYELDLLCVAPNANPPVCKILDYGKHRFEAQKKANELLDKFVKDYREGFHFTIRNEHPASLFDVFFQNFFNL